MQFWFWFTKFFLLMNLSIRNLVQILCWTSLTIWTVMFPQNRMCFTSMESFQRNTSKKQSYLFDADGNSFFLTVIIYSKVTPKFIFWMSFFFLVSCTKKKEESVQETQQMLLLCETWNKQQLNIQVWLWQISIQKIQGIWFLKM